MKRPVFIGLAFFSIGLPCLSFASPAKNEIQNPAAPTALYDVRGTWVDFDAPSRQATISHEKIPGYMEAMTMSFDLRGGMEPADIKRGDKVAFRLCVQGDDAWIDHLTKTGSASEPLLVHAVLPAHELSVGDVLPDVELTSQAGNQIHLSDFRGEVLAITFIYTACPLPTYCLRMSNNFKAVQALMERLAPRQNWHLLSISFDAARDRPEVLAAYARAYGAEEKRWTFSAATAKAVHTVGDGIGLEFKHAGNRIDHNLRTVVLDAKGRIRCIFSGNSWTPQELAAQMHAALR